MAQKRGFMVKVAKEETVKAAIPAVQNDRLSLSNLDLMFPPLDFGAFICYHKTKTTKEEMGLMSFASMVNVMKTALSETLVSYYSLAGEIVENRGGEPELLCNNGGVGFIEAHADVELDQLDLYQADESIGRLMPRKKHGVLAIQATELKCGSVAVACVFDHRVLDAYSANMFILSWAETARTKTVTVVPTIRPSLLNPRLPPRTEKPMPVICPRPPSEDLQPLDQNDDNRLEGRIYYIKANKIKNLQSLCCSNGRYNTKFESFAAFMWKLVAKSCEEDGNVKSHMGIVVDGRKKLNPSEDNDCIRKPTSFPTRRMETYFGNVLSFPFNGHKVKDLVANPLTWVANEVHQVIEHAATKEHFMDLIDHIQEHRPNPVIFAIHRMDGPALVVSSGLQFRAAMVDFGWGSPVFVSCYYPFWGNKAGYVMPVPAATVDGDWVVYMSLKKRQLDVVEDEAADTFVPLRSHHFLKLN